MTPSKRRQGTRGARKPVKTTMADYAMSFERLGQWMSERARSPTLPHPRATSLSMLDGAVAAVVAGPVSMPPEEWVCPLLGVDPDAFNRDTEEFSAIAATLMRHNAISQTLSTRPESFEPLFVRSPDGEVDPQPWCMGFYAVTSRTGRARRQGRVKADSQQPRATRLRSREQVPFKSYSPGHITRTRLGESSPSFVSERSCLRVTKGSLERDVRSDEAAHL